MKTKGMSFTIVFLANSANYGEGIGNINTLKKLSRGNGDQFTYISRQAIRYNIVEQLEEPLAKVKASGSKNKKVVQFSPDTTIEDYPELDFFGYMKTEKNSQGKKRAAVVRLSNAISTESFKGDLDFMTNKGLADRVEENPNPVISEIHRSYYVYTVAIDLDKVGIDKESSISLPNEEKARRVKKLLDTIAYLYRDIRGRRENLSPLFVIGGVYDRKNPFFENAVTVQNNEIQIEKIKSVLHEEIKKDTYVGVVDKVFANTEKIFEELKATPVSVFFDKLKSEVEKYYESN